MKKTCLLDIITCICDDTNTASDLKYLINYLYKISITVVKTKFLSKLRNSNYSAEDLAMDSIVPLFVKGKLGQLGIKRAITKWKDPLENNADVEYFLAKIVFRRVDQTFTKLIKENDPIFEKIHKTLSTCVSTNKFNKCRYFGTVYILEHDKEKIEGQLIREEDFNSIPIKILSYKQKELFEKLFDYIKTETEFFPAIPLNVLVHNIKRIYHEEYQATYQYDSTIDNGFIATDILNQGLKCLSEKLETFYIQKKIVSSNDAEMIMLSFNDISLDIKNGGMNSSLFSYLKHRKETLTQDEFYTNYHHVMNYLLKHFKIKISNLISS